CAAWATREWNRISVTTAGAGTGIRNQAGERNAQRRCRRDSRGLSHHLDIFTSNFAHDIKRAKIDSVALRIDQVELFRPAPHGIWIENSHYAVEVRAHRR